MLLLLLAVLAQDPDRSTPEKTYEHFTAFWSSLSNDAGDHWMKLTEEIEALGDAHQTVEFRARAAKRRKDLRAMMDDSRVVSSKHSIAKKAENADGSVTLEGVNHVRRKRRDFETEKVEEIDEALPHRLVLVKSGAAWLVREIYRSCLMCGAKGVCANCDGTGAMGEEKCPGCEGQKTCKTCSGSRLVREDLAAAGMDLTVADAPKVTSDLATPKAAAQAYSELAFVRTIRLSQGMQKFIEGVMANFRLLLAPEVLQSIEDAVAKAVEAGRARGKEGGPRVESVEEKGERAFAILVERGGDNARRQRIVFRKVGDKWLVDAEEHPCWCKEGKCTACDGAGTIDGEKCAGCAGTKVCAGCKGEGWVDPAEGNP
jgi:hypothetical protein